LTCRSEAPDVEQFARVHESEIEVIGLGAQDSPEEAREFVEDRGTTFTMLWDESFESWIQLGVTSQPTAIRLTPDGTITTGWTGRFPEDQVLELAGQYTAG
jgi:peroxiredoxin